MRAVKITQFRFWSVFAASICALVVFAGLNSLNGCERFANHTNPVAGWQVDFKGEPSKAVEKDYQDYLQKLPSSERPYAGVQSWLTDGTGQHAIVIAVALNGTDWGHVLIYDQNDKRIKVVKYIMGHYAC
jgi:hypothetical protein